LMFSEPESLEESTKPVELPTSSNDFSLTSFGDGSCQMLSELEPIVESIEPVELPTAFNASPLGHCDTASFLFQERVELPTSSYASFPSFISPSPNPPSLHLPQSSSTSSHVFSLVCRDTFWSFLLSSASSEKSFFQIQMSLWF
jgi:hypothetical protein